MNCLRARSRPASWFCMSSKVAASRPSSSSESARIGFEKSPSATLRAARSSRSTRLASALRDQVAAHQRQQQRDDARGGDLAADEG